MQKSTLLFLSLFLSVVLQAQPNLREQVKEAAVQGVSSFLNLIPQGQEQDYGFNSRADFDKVIIGEPYQTYFVVKQANELLFADGNQWRVPLVVNGEFVALATVQLQDAKGQVVDFGATRLAKELQSFEKEYKGANEHVLVRNTVLVQDYIAPNFSALCSQEKSDKGVKINTKSTELLYPISRTKVQPLKVATLKSLTLAAPTK